VSGPGAAHPNWLHVLAAPLSLAAASSVGFVAAFLWGDIGRYLCWFGIGLLLIVIVIVIVIVWLAAFRLSSRTVPR
jgi:hypothetical protein